MSHATPTCAAFLGLWLFSLCATRCTCKRIRFDVEHKEMASSHSTDSAIIRNAGSAKTATGQHHHVADAHSVDSLEHSRTGRFSRHTSAPESNEKTMIFIAVVAFAVIGSGLLFFIVRTRSAEDASSAKNKRGGRDDRPKVTFSKSVEDKHNEKAGTEPEAPAAPPATKTQPSSSSSAQRRQEAEDKWKPNSDGARHAAPPQAEPEQTAERPRRNMSSAEEAAEARKIAEEKEQLALAAKAEAKAAEQKAEEAEKAAKNVVSKLNVEWMYGDAGKNSVGNTLARLDPLRWSGGLTFDKCIEQLQDIKKKGIDRPIIVRVPAGPFGTLTTLDGPKAALAFVKTACPLRKAAQDAMDAAGLAAANAVAKEKKAKNEAQKARAREQQLSAKLKGGFLS